ncbi:MAG: 3-phosphoglycerate dehydrogenase [Clostridia bacterium]|nr:3-phosphoglycerate dehydrogenase [Clostridia bacterium]
MFTIQTYNKISDAGRRAFDETKYTITEDTKNPDAIIVHSTPLHDLEFAPSLRAIVRVGAGVNTIPVDRCTKAGIAVFNTPGGNANAVKELTIAAMIMSCRNVQPASEWVNSLRGGESDPGKTVEKGKEVYRGTEIMGKTIGIIGVGAIGSRVAKACYDLGMTVIGYDPYLPSHRKDELKQYVNFVSDVKELYADADFVSIHIPQNEANMNFIDAGAIAAMKDGVYIVNYARGGVVDNDAIVAALDSGKVKGFATDFPTANELGRKDVVCTPHLGAGTPQADENCAIMASVQIKDYLEDGNIKNSVNFPDVSFARAFGDRITLFHNNRVGMLGEITEKVTAAGLNIENLINKARGDYAYTILDFNVKVPADLIGDLEKIDGMVKVRLFK